MPTDISSTGYELVDHSTVDQMADGINVALTKLLVPRFLFEKHLANRHLTDTIFCRLRHLANSRLVAKTFIVYVWPNVFRRDGV